MLKLHPIEFFFRAIPEGFLFVLAVYIFSNAKVDKKKYIISSVVFATSTFLIRLLPIDYGVHTILALMILVILITTYNKIDVIKAMKSVLIISLIQFLIEGLNVLILKLMPNININTLFENPITKTIVGLPSLIVAYLIVWLFYLLNKKKEE